MEPLGHPEPWQLSLVPLLSASPGQSGRHSRSLQVPTSSRSASVSSSTALEMEGDDGLLASKLLLELTHHQECRRGRWAACLCRLSPTGRDGRYRGLCVLGAPLSSLGPTRNARGQASTLRCSHITTACSPCSLNSTVAGLFHIRLLLLPGDGG